jgi:hypothetical protein
VRWSEGSGALLASYEKTGIVPPALASKPDLTVDVAFYIEAFYFLSGFRSQGFSGPGSLLFSDIIRYAELVGYTASEDIQFFASVMLSCDIAFRKAISDKPKPVPVGTSSGAQPKSR